MSIRVVSATDWGSAKSTLNTVIGNCNSVHISSTSGTITPSITLQASQSTISRSVSSGDNIDKDHYSDSDGIVTKYNFMRKYESARRRDNGGTWYYNRTVSSSDVEGDRDGDFSASTPAYITPPDTGETIENIVESPARDILEIVTDGASIHNTGILGVGAGSETIEIDECHSNCHGSCHNRCNRSKR